MEKGAFAKLSILDIYMGPSYAPVLIYPCHLVRTHFFFFFEKLTFLAFSYTQVRETLGTY